MSDGAEAPRPYTLVAELTYRCPLACGYCSNPLELGRHTDELDTAAWARVFAEAAALGVLQVNLTGGEPLVRDDLEILVAEAHQLGYYTNLITSGVGLSEQRIKAFKEAGLDHIQLSFQDSTQELNDFLTHTRTFDLKERVMKAVRAHGYPTVLNVVLHRLNIDHIEQILAMAEAMGVEYLELANTQFYAWAMVNRDLLLPTLEQVERAEAVTNAFRERNGGKMRVFFVVPDYYAKRPKACMNGWGSVFLTITADGVALPCHEARQLPGLTFPNVREAELDWIWNESPGFNAYRGDAWMQEPCRTCPEKTKDFGGCRCQAYLLTGDATNADPACELSPHHHLIGEAVQRAAAPAPDVHKIVFRNDKNSRALSER